MKEGVWTCFLGRPARELLWKRAAAAQGIQTHQTLQTLGVSQSKKHVQGNPKPFRRLKKHKTWFELFFFFFLGGGVFCFCSINLWQKCAAAGNRGSRSTSSRWSNGSKISVMATLRDWDSTAGRLLFLVTAFWER